MARKRKCKFPRVEACADYSGVRMLLGSVRGKSAEYEALMLRWREICRARIWWHLKHKVSSEEEHRHADEIWRGIYQQCPSGSLEETVAVGVWQSLMPYDESLADYRFRVRSEALRVARMLSLKI